MTLRRFEEPAVRRFGVVDAEGDGGTGAGEAATAVVPVVEMIGGFIPAAIEAAVEGEGGCDCCCADTENAEANCLPATPLDCAEMERLLNPDVRGEVGEGGAGSAITARSP